MRWIWVLPGLILAGCDVGETVPPPALPTPPPRVDVVPPPEPPPPPRPDDDDDDNQDPQPREDIEIEFKVRVEEAAGTWGFFFEGSTNLPKDSVLRLTVFYPEPWERQMADGTIQRDTIADYLFMHEYEKLVRVREDGTFSARLYRLRRRPFSMNYRARASCATGDQDTEILEAIRRTRRFGSEGKMDAHFDFVFGNPGDFEAEQQASAQALKADFDVFDRMLAEMKEQFDRHRVRFDERAWREWRNRLSVRLAAIKDANEERFTLFRVFRERRGKFHVADIARFIEEDADLLERTLRDPSPENLAKSQEERQELIVGIEDRKRELALDEPNPLVLKGPVNGVLGKVQTAVEFARAAMRGKLAKDMWRGDREILLEGMSAVVFELAKEEPNKTFKLYPYVAQTAAAFEGVISAVDAHLRGATDATRGRLQAAIDALLEASVELRKFALGDE
jgi:hypothetical protein